MKSQAVKRNLDRFPEDFVFQLTTEEAAALRCQSGISKMSVFVIRAFVRMRQTMAAHTGMAEKLAELERRVTGHDEAIRSLVQTIRQLMAPPAKPRRSIGFRIEEGRPVYGRRRPSGRPRA